jgi:MFS superfamily sulfate permease-like transporter
MEEVIVNKMPKDGIEGLKDNFQSDALAGFVVFLLALPLSLGIAKASDFPPIMGLTTSIIGGLLVSLIMGARLTIKGPAAGLIVIVAGAVADFGGGIQGWQLACGVLAISGMVQVIFGILKLGKLVDFFPLSAIRGMLAAIGLIIILKQFPVLLGINPAEAKGKGPFELLASIPMFFQDYNFKATVVGFISFAIMMTWPLINNSKIKLIPASLVVLLFAIPIGIIWDFKATIPSYEMVHIDDFISTISFHADFSGYHQAGIFIKYLIMFSLIGSIESLLTVKAIDLMDPYKRKTDSNKDLIAVGLGNTLAALLGGLPMISEVARSSANVNNGAKTRWANFFHGLFIIFFLLVASCYIEMIPNSALAAMLISVGIRLAHPNEFLRIFNIGKEQLLVFLVTIFFTLFEDLLIGIFTGMLVEVLLHIYYGAPISAIFKAPTQVSFDENKNYLVEIDKAAIFSNYLGIKSKLDAIPETMNVTIDLKNTKFIDHSVLDNLYQFKNSYILRGGKVQIIGLDNHASLSNNDLASRKSATMS